MKLVSLNTWGATQGQILFDFVQQHKADTDIFCFQEVFSVPAGEQRKESRKARVHLFEELSGILPEFAGYFESTSVNHDILGPVDFDLSFGLATFVKKDLEIGTYQVFPTFGNKTDIVLEDFSNIPRAAQQITIRTGHGECHVVNFHGIPMPGNKLDTPDRLEQSRLLNGILRQFVGPKIMCGDFNLELETESIKMLGKEMRNLIRDYKIENTRNEISWAMYPGSDQHYADYTFVSPNVKVKKFEVPYNLVSDHLPMILTFQI